DASLSRRFSALRRGHRKYRDKLPAWESNEFRARPKLFDGSQPGRECPDDFLARMAMPADDIEAVPRQAQIKCLYERPRCKLGGHEHIAEDANALSGNDGLDRVQLFPKAE